MIVDCGGGTIDLTTYKFVTANPILVEETTTPGCEESCSCVIPDKRTDSAIGILQGSTRVNARFYEFLRSKLANSDYGNDDDLKVMMERFEKSTKPTFNDPSVRAFIRFGSIRDKDPAVGIRNGQLTIEGYASPCNALHP